jgi:N-methylhydantoinase A
MPRSKPASELRIAVDTGGTFTDCVWAQDGSVRMLKVFSTPDDPSRAIVAAIKQILSPFVSPASRVASAPAIILLHGTTVGTNTLLQRKGARVAFVTTKGFEDTIEIGRQARPKLYDLFFDKVEPLVPTELRFGADERTVAGGEIIRQPQQLDELSQRIEQSNPESLAISLLFSFENPSNEQAVIQALSRTGIPLSVSHQLLPEFREYERASTVVVNAYLQPVMQRYLTNLASNMEVAQATSSPRVFVMQSSGGLTSLETAAREPVRTVLSGPAGGVVGAAAMARASGFKRIIGFDMGGTSTDVCLVDGEAKATNEADVAGFPVRVPMLDIHTVGAGGGSIARFDAAGALRVGPESAGAAPGPICYGRGEQPTVTDANLLLGRLRPDAFLGGDFKLNIDRTRRIITSWLKQNRSNLTVDQFAEGIVRVVNSTMEKAIRVVSIERGYDPRDFALVAFGGAGGLHACDLAAALSISTVIVPAMPGALSAYGILVSEIVKDYSQTVLCRVSNLARPVLSKLEKHFRALADAARIEFQQEGWKGTPSLIRTADLRYAGQGFELNVGYSAKMLQHFHAEHKRRYGYSTPERQVEIVTIRLRARLAGSKVPALKVGANIPVSMSKPAKGVLARDQLKPGKLYRGPAIITEYSATTVVPQKASFQVDTNLNLMIRLAT